MTPNKTYFNWSGGKDSALAMYHIMKDSSYDVRLLLTSVNAKFQRISMHGVRTELLRLQSQNMGIPLQTIELEESPTMNDYNTIMRETISVLKEGQFTHGAFGDIFLEDLKEYRMKQLAEVGISTHFPIWGRNTKELLHEFLDLGFKTIVVCVNDQYLDESYAGKVIDHDFIKELPANVDPCGENGEFHTFVFDGPIFKNPIGFSIGEKIHRKYPVLANKEDQCFSTTPPVQPGFWFCDLIPQ